MVNEDLVSDDRSVSVEKLPGGSSPPPVSERDLRMTHLPSPETVW